MDENEVIAMALTCTRCGTTVRNDLPRSQIPTQLEFMKALRDAGWSIHEQHWNQTHRCPKCASSS